MASTFYDSALTAEQIEAALTAISGLIVSANNGKVLVVETGVINAKAVTDYINLNLQSKTVTPSASQQVVSPDSGYNGLSSVTVSGDANLVAGNIKSGVSIFGVTGSYSGGGSPSLQSKSVTPTAAGLTVEPDQGYDGLSAVSVSGDANLVASKIKKNVTIFGVTGTYEGSGGGGRSVQDVVDALNGLLSADYRVVPPYTSAANPTGYTWSCSGQYSTTPGWTVFREDMNVTIETTSSVRWTQSVTATAWVQIQLPSARAINSFFLESFYASSLSASFCKDFRIQGSNDGSAWTDLYTGSFPNSHVMQYYALAEDTAAYLYYRFVAESSYSSSYIGLTRFWPMYIDVEEAGA